MGPDAGEWTLRQLEQRLAELFGVGTTMTVMLSGTQYCVRINRRGQVRAGGMIRRSLVEAVTAAIAEAVYHGP